MSNMAPIIHIIDDDASFRTAIGDLLRACDFRVAHYESAAHFLEKVPSDEPACILLDVHMPGLSGPQLQDHLTSLGSGLPIIFMTGDGDIPTSVKTIKSGADDFLIKPIPKERLLTAIERALLYSEEMRLLRTRVGVLRALVSGLTPREHEVFVLLARGWPHKKIADSFGTSERTIKFHRHNLMQKLAVHSLAELAVIAERLGLLSGSKSSKK
jgi:FixJ family two-component response regulator